MSPSAPIKAAESSRSASSRQLLGWLRSQLKAGRPGWWLSGHGGGLESLWCMGGVVFACMGSVVCAWVVWFFDVCMGHLAPSRTALGVRLCWSASSLGRGVWLGFGHIYVQLSSRFYMASHGVVAPFAGSRFSLAFPRCLLCFLWVHLVHILGLVCVACHLAVRWCGVPDGGCSRADSGCPPLRDAPRLLIEPRAVPFGLAPAGFCLGHLSMTAVWCACASCLGSLGALVCIAWVFVMLHVPSASVQWVFGIPLLLSGLVCAS